MTTPKRPYLRDFLYGLLGGVIATVALYIGTDILGLPFPPEAIFGALIAPVPGSIQSVAVETLRQYAKYSAFTAAAAFYSVIYGAIAVLVGFFSRRSGLSRDSALLATLLIPTAIGLGLEASLAPRVSALSSAFGWATASALILVVNLFFGWIVVGASAKDFAHPVVTFETKPAVLPSRRSFLKKAVIAAVVLAVAGIAAKIGISAFTGQPLVKSGTPIPINNPPIQTSLTGVPDVFNDPRIADLISSEVTDTRLFYRVDIDAFLPQINFDQWSLRVHGKVNNELTLNKNSLMALPTSDEDATLECISNTINPPGALISNAKWTGVPLSTILNQAGLPRDAKYVVFHCADGYTVGIPIERALEQGALLAYKMNDETLPNEHGFPLRAIVPGIYGMMNAKWVTEIEVVDHVYLGYWQERGWTNDARIKTTSIIYYPPSGTQVGGTLPIAGVAFAGDRSIGKVEVSTDNGQTWNKATLKTPRSRYSWVLWALRWTPAAKGNYSIMARATDGNGELQDVAVSQPFPNGATGYNSVEVTVS